MTELRLFNCEGLSFIYSHFVLIKWMLALLFGWFADLPIANCKLSLWVDKYNILRFSIIKKYMLISKLNLIF